MLILFLNTLVVLALPQEGAEGKWKYAVPAAADGFHHPPLRVLPLSTTRPDDVRDEVKYRGTRRRYAQFHYGNPATVRIAVVLDERGEGQFDLFVDANRNRVIEAEELVPGMGPSWQVPLAAVLQDGGKQSRYDRQVLFRYGPATRSLSYATCGFLAGKVKMPGEAARVRRMDGDANGLFADAQDRVWIDLEGYDRWDPVDHQFPFAPVLTLNKQRYVVQSDPGGERFQLRPLEGVGTIRLRQLNLQEGVVVDSITATLNSKDGIVATLTGLDTPVTLPVGDYTFTSLTLALRKNGALTSYVFSSQAVGGTWNRLEKNGSLSLDPLGTPRLEVSVNHEQLAAGADLMIQPQLYTATGLVINTVYHGRERPVLTDGSIRATMLVHSSDGTRLGERTSGFA
jgi:hypothetical protein